MTVREFKDNRKSGECAYEYSNKHLKFKPCPLCGDKNIKVNTDLEFSGGSDENGYSIFIKCKCGLNITDYVDFRNDTDHLDLILKIYAKWNKRNGRKN